MIRIKTELNNKIISEFEFPSKVEEVKLSSYIPFDNKHTKLLAYVKEKLEENPDYLYKPIEEINYTVKIIDVLCAFLKCKPADIFTTKIGPIDKHLRYLKYKKKIKPSDIQGSIFGIFNYLHQLMADYKPKMGSNVYEYEYKGEVWKVTKPIKTGSIKKELTVGQCIIILDAYNSYVKGVEDGKNEDNYRYTYLLTCLAAMVYKKGDKKPKSMYELTERVQDRLKSFQDISMNVALDVEFFFWSYYSSLEKDPDNRYYFDSPAPQPYGDKSQREAILKAITRAKRESKTILSRIGYKSLESRFLSKDDIINPKKQKQFVNTPMGLIVRRLSLENANIV